MEMKAIRRTAVVTGASSGIGKATAAMLVALGWRVLGVGRDRLRCDAAAAEIAAATRDGGEFTMLRGDFTLMAEVSRVARDIRGHTERIDILINNAGGVRDRQVITSEGTEATFAANHLASFLLTRELMPSLRATSAGLQPGVVRIIAVSSSAHRISTGLDWADLQSLGTFQPAVAYGQAKLANILFTRELSRRIAVHGMVAHAMHPGVVATNFVSHADTAMQSYLATAESVTPDEPAETLVWLATAAELGHGGGRYFHRNAEEIPAASAQDDSAAARLWTESEKLLAELGF